MPNPKGQITPNFAWAEAVCRCGCTMPQGIREEIRRTAEWAERIRSALGDSPMKILSWYRCRKWNAHVGGAPSSQHLQGRAIDFVIRDLSTVKTQAEIVLLKLYPSLIRGLGKYVGFTHIDRREGAATSWTVQSRLRADVDWKKEET